MRQRCSTGPRREIDRPDAAGPARLDARRARLDEPLRVAIAGKVKAGKSTLLNALVGEELAPTDAGECTRIVTWYRDGPTYRGHRCTSRDGAAEPRPFNRVAGAMRVVARPAGRRGRPSEVECRARACASTR